jgi:hypothetical protein
MTINPNGAPPNGSKELQIATNTKMASFGTSHPEITLPPKKSNSRHKKGGPARPKAAVRTRTPSQSDSGHTRASKTPTKSTNAPNRSEAANRFPHRLLSAPLFVPHPKSPRNRGKKGLIRHTSSARRHIRATRTLQSGINSTRTHHLSPTGHPSALCLPSSIPPQKTAQGRGRGAYKVSGSRHGVGRVRNGGSYGSRK